jgi:tetratricopeptide (TPR) repeat protein
VSATLVAADPLGFLFARPAAWAIDGRLVVDLPRSEAAAEVGGVGLDEVLGIYGESLTLLGRVVDPMIDPVPEEISDEAPVVTIDGAGWLPMSPELVRSLAAEHRDSALGVKIEERALQWLADAEATPWPDPHARIDEAATEFTAQGSQLAPERMDVHVALVHELADQLGGASVPSTLWGEGWAVDEWMWNLANTLAKADRVDDAVAVSEALATFHDPYCEEHLATAALNLARAGRAAEARPRLETLLAQNSEDRLVATLCAEAYEAIEDRPSAEGAYRRAVDLAVAGGQPDEVEDALRLLASFHESGSQAGAARAVRERLRSWQRETGRSSATLRPVRSMPKVGRNQPCPCGSGPKYKHCCGRSGA